jgi:hypothetical protein
MASAQPLALVVRQQLGRAEPRDLVAQRPQRVQPHGLVPGRVRQDVGVVAVGVAQVHVQRAEQQAGGDAPRRDGSARMSRLRHVVVQDRAQRPVDEIELLQRADVLGGERRAERRHLVFDIDEDRTTRRELQDHGLPFRCIAPTLHRQMRRSARRAATIGSGAVLPNPGM